MSYLSVSTWSLHRMLGPLRWTVWEEQAQEHKTVTEAQPELLTLLDLPSEAAKRGFRAVEICHFHFPETDKAYLNQLKAAFADAGISFDTLLLDYGDISSSDIKRTDADLRFMREWIGIASAAGAKRIRIIAGDAHPSDVEALERAARHLLALSEYAERRNMKIVTENFKALTSTGESCLRLMDRTRRQLGMITDFGNFSGENKFGELAMTVPLSVTVHVKAVTDKWGHPDETELRRCLDVVKEASFDGSLVMIYDGPGDMWEGIGRVRRVAESYL